jgi:hypothetical protein
MHGPAHFLLLFSQGDRQRTHEHGDGELIQVLKLIEQTVRAHVIKDVADNEQVYVSLADASNRIVIRLGGNHLNALVQTAFQLADDRRRRGDQDDRRGR